VFLYQIDNVCAVNTRPQWTPGVVGVLNMAKAGVTA
jgi:peptide/nickel transport system substrate-binding protein